MCLNFYSFEDFSTSVRYVTYCAECHFVIFQSLHCRCNISLNKKCQILVMSFWTNQNQVIRSLNIEPCPVFRQNLYIFGRRFDQAVSLALRPPVGDVVTSHHQRRKKVLLAEPIIDCYFRRLVGFNHTSLAHPSSLFLLLLN